MLRFSVDMTTSAFQTRFLISPQKMENLVEHDKGRLTENAQFNKAARLAAEEHAILKSNLLQGIKAARVRPMAAQLCKLTRRVRQGSTPTARPCLWRKRTRDLSRNLCTPCSGLC